MIKYDRTLTNKTGDVLSNHRAQVLDSSGSIVTIYSDSNGTRFTDDAGANVNYATSDERGYVAFYWTPASGQDLQILNASGNLARPTVTDFASQYSASGLFGSTAQETRSALASKGDAATNLEAAELTESGREGRFVFSTADLSTEVAADTLQGIYVPTAADPTGASGAWVRQFDVIRPEMFGAVADGTTDDTAAINAAISVAVANGYRRVELSKGTYRTTAPIAPTAEVFGLEIKGQGVFATTIEADHLVGEVVRLNRTNGYIGDLTISASATRTAGASGSNYGVVFEAPDTAAGAVNIMTAERVRVIDQPNDGFLQVGLSIMTKYIQCNSDENKGHGYHFDSGQLTGRANTNYPGLITMDTCWATENTGHGLKIGDSSDAANDLPVRFMIVNCEFADNALTAGKRVSLDEIWVRGYNITFDTCATGTVGSAVIGGIRFAGENLQIRNHRSISCTHTLRLEQDHVLTKTYGIKIDGLRCLNDAQNPAVIIEDLAAVSDVQVKTYGHSSNITRMFTAGAINCTWERFSPVSLVRKKSNQSVTSSTTLVDDTELQHNFGANEVARFECDVRYGQNATSDIKIAFVAPAGASVRWTTAGDTYVAANDTVAVSNSEVSEGGVRTFGSSGSGVRTAKITGHIEMGGTAGPLKMQFAQNTSDATATNVYSQSMLRIYRENSEI